MLSVSGRVQRRQPTPLKFEVYEPASSKGRQFATVALPSVELGNGLAYAAWLHLTGRSVPREINGQQTLVTRANVGRVKTYAEKLKRPLKVSFVKRSGKFWLVTR
jgi:hypothetical protein